MQRCTGSCVQNRPYTTPLGNPCEKHNMGPCLQITGKKIDWLLGSFSSFFPERGETKLITEVTFLIISESLCTNARIVTCKADLTRLLC